jgi:hypothetical protein
METEVIVQTNGLVVWSMTDENHKIYEGNSISKLEIQVSTYVFELSAGNCHR